MTCPLCAITAGDRTREARGHRVQDVINMVLAIVTVSAIAAAVIGLLAQCDGSVEASDLQIAAK